jgi:hypothetical protein
MEFFNDLSVPVKFLIAFVVALAMLGVVGYLIRRFSGPRGRQPRLAVINAASIDGRRRLVLVQRDDVEHLLLIGGPTDVVIESNIDRTGAVAPAPVPEPKASPPLPLPRQTLSLEGLGLPPGEPVYVEPPPPRPVREAAVLRPLPTLTERQRLETLSEEVGAPPLPTPLPDAGPALYPQPSFELPAHATPVAPSFEPVFQIPPAPEPKRMQDEKSNLSEMALRLEAALRRPIKPVEPASSAQ